MRLSRLPRPLLAALLVALAVVRLGGHGAPTAHANPAKVWVINDNVAAAMAMTTPASIDSALTGNSLTRLPYLSQFDAFQTASGGQVALTSAIPFAGNVFIVVQTDGSPDNVVLNGRGLTCTPACDATATSTPDATDHIVVYQVTGTGPHSVGDALVVTAQQDAVTLDSRTITIVGQAHDVVLSVAKTTIQAGLSICSLSDNTTSPQRTAASARYTDINGTPLVGYLTTWWSTSSPNMILGLSLTPAMVQLDGVTVTATNVACGVAAGSSDLHATNATSNAIQGIAGQVTRLQTITVTAGSVPPAPGVPHASSGGTTTTFEATASGGVPNSSSYQIDVLSTPACGAVSGTADLGTFPASTDASGNLKLYAIASSAVPTGWGIQATVTDPSSVTSPMSGCQTVAARACTDDTTCNGYTDAQKIALGKDPFTYCGIMRADVNMDGKVTLPDLILTAQQYNQTIPPANARYDQNADGKITLADLILEAGNYNKSVSACP